MKVKDIIIIAAILIAGSVGIFYLTKYLQSKIKASAPATPTAAYVAPPPVYNQAGVLQHSSNRAQNNPNSLRRS